MKDERQYNIVSMIALCCAIYSALANIVLYVDYELIDNYIFTEEDFNTNIVIFYGRRAIELFVVIGYLASVIAICLGMVSFVVITDQIETRTKLRAISGGNEVIRKEGGEKETLLSIISIIAGVIFFLLPLIFDWV